LCNLYSVTKGQQAIRELARAMRDRTGNLPPLYGIFPDYSAPIVRNQPEGRELMMARWGMPSPVFALRGKKTDPGVTNVRNVTSPHWRRWLGIENRCVVPWTSFSENEVLPDGSRPTVWFAFDETPAIGLLCRHLDALDLRPLRVSDDRAEQGGRGDPPESDARRSDGAGRDRRLHECASRRDRVGDANSRDDKGEDPH
jgi:putative SOS response-associated peptidase YedK